MDLSSLEREHQESSKKLQEYDEAISRLASELEELRIKRKLEEEVFEKIRKTKRSMKKNRIQPEILCDMFRFLKTYEIQQKREVSWWWDQVILSKRIFISSIEFVDNAASMPLFSIKKLKYDCPKGSQFKCLISSINIQ